MVGKKNKELLAAGLLPLAAKELLVAGIHSLLALRYFPHCPFSCSAWYAAALQVFGCHSRSSHDLPTTGDFTRGQLSLTIDH